MQLGPRCNIVTNHGHNMSADKSGKFPRWLLIFIDSRIIIVVHVIINISINMYNIEYTYYTYT
jgi:hypothetical protein